MLIDADLEKSFLSCEKLPSGVIDCFSGSLMEFNSPKQHTKSDETSLQKLASDPNYPCLKLQELYRSECYRYRGNINYLHAETDTSKAFQQCAKVDKAFDDICYQGIGNSIPSPTQSPAEIAEACQDALLVNHEAYQNCIKGVLPFLVQMAGGKGKVANDFCQAVHKDHRSYCYTQAKDYY